MCEFLSSGMLTRASWTSALFGPESSSLRFLDAEVHHFRILSPLLSSKLNKLSGLSPQASYTNRATAVCRRSYLAV
jgi:hypothetical protein